MSSMILKKLTEMESVGKVDLLDDLRRRERRTERDSAIESVIILSSKVNNCWWGWVQISF